MPERIAAPVLHAPSVKTDARGVAQRYVDRVLGQLRQQYSQFDQFPYRTWVFTCVIAAVMLWMSALTDYVAAVRMGPSIPARIAVPLIMGCWFTGMAIRHRRFDRVFRREAEVSMVLSTLVFSFMVQVNGIKPVVMLFGSTVSVYIAQRRMMARLAVVISLSATMIAALRASDASLVLWRAVAALVSCVLLMEWLMGMLDRAMATLRDASNSLDAVSQELVADRARLVEATGRAELEAQRKGDLMATVSHEIRTPMQAILGLSALMTQTPVTAQQREWLERIRENGQHLVGLVSDLLDYTRIESGKAALEHAPFHLEDVLVQVRDVLERSASEKGLVVSLVVAADVPHHLSGDRRRLTQLLLNYVTNAVKYTERGRVDVTVAATVRDRFVTLRVEVQDTGIGMSEAQQGRCFEPFERASNATALGTGVGLGLPICRWIAAQMQGAVGVKSAVGVGSTFWFEVQLERVDVVSRDLPTSTRRALPSLAGLRVLVVDDSRINRVVVSESLRRRGVDVMEADSGDAALALLSAHTFQLVVMDLQMPGIDGAETTRLARRQLGALCPPVIGMTASVMPGDEARCYHAGMVAFLAKPFEPERLLWEVAVRAGRVEPEGVVPESLAAVTPMELAPAQTLATVRGLDVAGGLRRLAGDEAAYRGLLADLVRDHADTVAQLTDLLASGDREGTTKLVHSLGGSCAVLGATAVRAALRSLETELVNGASIVACEEALAIAAAPIEELLTDLRAVFGIDADTVVPAA